MFRAGCAARSHECNLWRSTKCGIHFMSTYVETEHSRIHVFFRRVAGTPETDQDSGGNSASSPLRTGVGLLDPLIERIVAKGTSMNSPFLHVSTPVGEPNCELPNPG